MADNAQLGACNVRHNAKICCRLRNWRRLIGMSAAKASEYARLKATMLTACRIFWTFNLVIKSFISATNASYMLYAPEMNNFRAVSSHQHSDHSTRLRDHLVVILGWKEECCRSDAHGVEEQNNPADRAKDPGFVQCPADEEAVVVVVEVCLHV